MSWPWFLLLQLLQLPMLRTWAEVRKSSKGQSCPWDFGEVEREKSSVPGQSAAEGALTDPLMCQSRGQLLHVLKWMVVAGIVTMMLVRKTRGYLIPRNPSLLTLNNIIAGREAWNRWLFLSITSAVHNSHALVLSLLSVITREGGGQGLIRLSPPYST